MLGPHTHTPAPTARGWRTPTAHPVGGQSGEGERLTSDAPRNGGRHPPWGRPSATRQRATPARNGARCGAGAWSPRPHRPHPGHMGRQTPAARPRGWAARGGTAPDTRRPSQQWQATPPGTAPHHPRSTQPPQGMQAKGTVLGPHTDTIAPTARGWRIPTARAVGGQSGEGERLTSDAPHNSGRHPPRGRPFRHPHSEQRRPATARAVGPVLGPHARTDRTWNTQVAESRLPAPEDGQPGEGQRLTPDAPDNSGRPPPRGRPLTTPTARRACRPRGQCRAPTPTHPRPQHVGGGPQQPAQWAGSRWRGSASPQTPLTMVEGTPLGTPSRHPHSEQRRPARAHAVGPVLAPHARTDRTQDTRVAEPRPPAPENGRLGEGQRLTSDAPSQRWQATPPGDCPPPTPRHAAPAGHAGQADSAGPPHPHTRAHSTWVADPNSPPSGQAVGGRGAPDLRRPSQRSKAPPPGTPSSHPHREQRRPARAHAVGPVLGPHARTDRTGDTRVMEPRPPAPEDGRLGEEQRLTPDAPHNGGRHSPRARPSATTTASNAGPQGRTLWGWCWVPRRAPTAPGTHGSRNLGCPPQTTDGPGRDSA